MKTRLSLLPLLLSLLLSLTGCDLPNEVRSLTSHSKEKLIWVWAQFNVPITHDKFETYYYYGRVPQKLFDDISHNKIDSGFILMRSVRYWGKDDLVHAFKDRENTGDILFRIEDLRRAELIANEPIVGRSNEQYAEPNSSSSAPSSSDGAASKTTSSNANSSATSSAHSK